MREIKFRAWGVLADKGPKRPRMFRIEDDWSFEFATDGFTLTNLGDEKGFGHSVYSPHFTEPLTLMQFVGRKDKNGKEIYEDDVVVHYYKPTPGLPTPNKSQPYVIDSLWQFAGIMNRYSVGDVEVEVLGNIHENPELAKL